MFSLNDKVVYPGYGVASICRIFEKIINNESNLFFELKFQKKDMTIMVPANKLQEVGIRHLSSNDFIVGMLDTMMVPARSCKILDPNANNWNKRNKEYQSKLKTGALELIWEIYQDLKYISLTKQLSFGEKNLVSKTEMLLVEEIAAVQKIDFEEALDLVRCSVGVLQKNNNSFY